MTRKTLRFADIILALMITFGFLYLPTLRAGEPESAVLVTVDGRKLREPLAPDRKVSVAGPLGITIVEIKADRARIVESPCQGKQCVRQGWVEGGGGAAVCAPNRVTVEVGGAGRVDAVLR